MGKHYWLVKQEPADYPWEQLVREGGTAWTGVRNFQARNYLRQMQPGDEVFYYHSGEARCVVGVAQVTRAAHPDPTASEGAWVCVELKPLRPLARPVTLTEMKDDKLLQTMPLIRQSRLSVCPVTEPQARRLLELGA